MIDVTEITEGFMINVICHCVFSSELNACNELNKKFKELSHYLTKYNFQQKIISALRIFCPSAVKLFHLWEFPREIEVFITNLFQIAQKLRKDEANRGNDILQFIFDLRDQELIDYKEKGEKGMNSKGMLRGLLRSNG